jgi:hypothetical protein
VRLQPTPRQTGQAERNFKRIYITNKHQPGSRAHYAYTPASAQQNSAQMSDVDFGIRFVSGVRAASCLPEDNQCLEYTKEHLGRNGLFEL